MTVLVSRAECFLDYAKVSSYYLINGDYVQKGDIVLAMDSTEIVAERIRLEREMQTAQLDVMRLQAALDNLLTGKTPSSTTFDHAEQPERRRQWGFLRSTLAAHQAKNASLVSDGKRFTEQEKKLEKVIAARRKLADSTQQKITKKP